MISSRTVVPVLAVLALAACASRERDADGDPSRGDAPIVHVAYKSWKRSVDVDLAARTLSRSRTECRYSSRTSGTPPIAPAL